MELGNYDGSARSTSKPPVYYIVSASNHDRLKTKEIRSKDREFRFIRKQLSRLVSVCEDLVQRKPERAGSGMNKMLGDLDSYQRESSLDLQQRRKTSSARSEFEFRHGIRCSLCSLSNENISMGSRTKKEGMRLRRCKSFDFEATCEKSDYHAVQRRNELDAPRDKERLANTSSISRTSLFERNYIGPFVDKRIANSGFRKRSLQESDSDSSLDEDETSLVESILEWHGALNRVIKSSNILRIKLMNLGEGTSESASTLERLRRETWRKMKMAEEVISLLENGIHEDDENSKDKYLHLQEN